MLPFIVLGLTTGAVYALAGLGLVLTYKTSGVLNFAASVRDPVDPAISLRHSRPRP